jgi:Phosphotransferase enzyme family
MRVPVSALAVAELDRAVERVFGAVRVCRCAPHPMRSSAALWELELEFGDGSRRTVLLKDLGYDALSADARRAKPGFLLDPARELEVYEALPAELGVARLYGVDRSRHWLFIELVDGVPLWQVGDESAWVAAARWLGRLHRSAVRAPAAAVRYDPGFYARWMPRALRFAPDAELSCIEAVHARAVERLAAAPQTFIHGEFYPSNVLVRRGRTPSVCPVDFELAGVGPAVLDLAALVTGLPAPLGDRVLAGYLSALGAPPPRAELEQLLLCARLHLAVRWLGWSADWEPPAHQQHDWAREARSVAGRLEWRL